MSSSVRSTALAPAGAAAADPAMADSLAPNEWPQLRKRKDGIMRVVVIGHHEEDSAGFVGDAFRARGAELSMHLFPKDGPLPDLDGADHVIVLGAIWSVYDDSPDRAWIADELAW